MRILAALALALVLAAPAAATPASDVRLLGRQLETTHPNLFRNISKATFRAAVEDVARRAPDLTPNQLLVELMKLTVLPGNRNGHMGIFPGDQGHRQHMHLYPLRLYEFTDGLYVVDETPATHLRGARLTAIAGVPIERVKQLVAPLVPRDNAWSLKGLLPHFAVCAEVLDALGIGSGIGERVFTFDRGEVTIAPAVSDVYHEAFVDPLIGGVDPSALPAAAKPMYLANKHRALWLKTLQNGRAIYVGYNFAGVPTFEVAQRLARLASNPKVQRVIVDVRMNPGGNNTTYGPLLATLRSKRINRRGHLFLLTGRATFSASGNFATDVADSTRALVVGEPTGGGVNQYGDATTIVLPTLGWRVWIATSYQQFASPKDRRLAVMPDIAVPLTAADYFARRDPVLARALAS